jgi:hypothetical protein
MVLSMKWSQPSRRIGLALLLFALPSATAQPPLGPDLRVSTSDVPFFARPDVAVGPTGGFVVVWSGSDSYGLDLFTYARLYDDGGAPLGPGFQVDGDQLDDYGDPAVARAPSGDFVVVWIDYDGDRSGIFGRCLDAAGSPAVPSFQVNTTSSYRQIDPHVAADPDGGYVVVWESQSQDGDQSGVFGRLLDSGCVPVGGELQVNQTAVGSQYEPAVDFAGADDIVVVWQAGDSQDGSDSGIFARRFDDLGVAQVGEFQVNTSTAGYQEDPAVAAGPGGFVVAWESADQDGYGVFAQRFGPGMPVSMVGGELRVNSFTTSDQRFVDVAADSVGNFVVVWESGFQDGDQQGVFGQLFRSDGTPAGGELQVSSETAYRQRFPAVAFSDSGTFVVVWNTSGGGSSTDGIFARRFTTPFAADADLDGVDDAVEDAAANGGDGNGDGIPDSRQLEVASLPNAEDGRYVTLVALGGANLGDVRALPNPSPADAPPGVDFPVGFFEFVVTGLDASTAVVELLLPPSTPVDAYLKYGPTPSEGTDHWYDFLFDGATGAEIFPDRIVLHFVDGDRGDDDLAANGRIVEPGGPGRAACDFGPPDQPVVFQRGTGQPVRQELEWESCGGEGTLRVESQRVASALLFLNGTRILAPADFHDHETVTAVPVSLEAGVNLLEVELRGRPGGRLTVELTPG